MSLGPSYDYEIVEILKSEQGKKGNSIDLMVVRWGKKSPVLEKRRRWDPGDGTPTRMKGLVGLSKDDFDFVLSNSEKINKLLQSRNIISGACSGGNCEIVDV